MSIRRKTAKGLSWTVLAQQSRMLINLGVLVVLARLLSPREFGLIAMVTAFTNFFSILNELGFARAIIYKKDVSEKDLSSAFWINLFQGMALSLVVLALSPLIAGFYSSEQLQPVVMVLSLVFTVSSFGMIEQALFMKEMSFKIPAIIEILSSVSAAAVAIVAAASGFGVWSLVFQSLVYASLTAVLFFIFSDWKPRLTVDWEATKGLFGYGLPVSGFFIVNYFSRNLDNLLIGRFLGAFQVGCYDLAYKSLLLPLSNVSSIIGRVMFPAMSTLQDDNERAGRAYVKATRYIALLTFPITIGLAILAPELVRLFLGPKWNRAIFLIQVFALIGGLQTIYITYPWIYLSKGRTRTLFRIGLVFAVVSSASFLVGLHWQVEGVAIAYAIAFIVMLLPIFAYTLRLVDLKLRDYVRRFGTIFASTAGMAGLMVGLKILLQRAFDAGDILTLVALVVAGAVSYAGFILLLDMDLVKGLRVLLRDVRSKEPLAPEGLPPDDSQPSETDLVL